ncbi:ArsR/SmtB family transcription factor [Limnoglobus roseus]|uniref:ArsR family transcriptional regulator n=1 Tax=Limnoglobus roseus TaxID=2598579 RepID=A0A5C1AIS0_9BACT|nr:metalloregulator ArsR/SmtB family transcription factor [Limnoglobus roseus]QEL17582.1 ArsR family transcriptional regulator [Limnoglobus roseus]
MISAKPTRDPDRHLSEQLAAIAEPTRIRILRALAGGPLSVGKIAECVGNQLVNVSHHLRLMMRVGILTHAKVGRTIEYRFADGVFEPIPVGPAIGQLALGTWRVVIGRRTAHEKTGRV